jgi:hypothetical protein
MIHGADYLAAAFAKRSGLMRIAISAVAIASVVASSAALASPSCMTQSEARAKFTTSHLYWHGAGHCWDATPPSRQHLAQRIKARKSKPAESEARAEREAVEEKQPDEKKRPGLANVPRWREAMSRMRAEDMVSMQAPARASASAEPVEPPAPRTNFWDRWVEIAQRAPPIVDKAGPSDIAADARLAEPIVTPVRVMLALLVLVLTIGAAELLLRRERRS